MAPHPFFAGYLLRPTRRQGRAWPSLRRSVALGGTDGRAWACVAPEYGKGNSVYGRACGPTGRPIRIGPPYGWTARSGARMSAAGASPKKEADPARGRSRPGCGPQIRIRAARRGRPLRVTGGPRHDRTQAQALVEAGTDAPLSGLLADRAYDRDGFRAGRAQRGIKAVLPARRGRLNPTPRPGKVPGAPGRGTGPRRAQTLAPAWPPLRPIRAAVPGFSVPDGGLAPAAILNQHALVHGHSTSVRLCCRSHRQRQPRRGSHAPAIRTAPDRVRTAVSEYDLTEFE